ncbi:MAG TPA: YbbR-like domain-containing protein [Nitrospirae bacterium]|nr:YbbR-like protein [bacterium BMS3Abin09]GBE41788.1 YbbR-like protein [bacterium BMS3Bbin09]HDN95414.1 YbbR-like domain-containing protein [Nitrospirota bacterium]HDO66765.1 YbbR-like domain-containing protein [Nitrospirota bacterium]HDZ84750.1 YbbR-like domain-containing protein [Nitrospirota bacterium]
MMKGFFTKNLWLKLASLILATALWLFVILSGRTEVTMDVPVVYSGLQQYLDLIDSPKKVRVSIEGQGSLLKNIRRSEIKAVIDLSETKSGRSFFTLTKENFELPKTLLLTNIDPETISVTIESELKKRIPVKPVIVGRPEKGFTIFEIKVVPENIVVEGPKSLVRKIYTVKTEPIDINGLNTDLNFKANLDFVNSTIRKSVNKVEVNITVKKLVQGDK